MIKKTTSLFLKKTGDNVMMRVLEIFIEGRGIEYSKQDVIEFSEKSKNTIYKTWDECIKNKYFLFTKKIGNTELFILNEDNIFVKSFIEIYDNILKDVLIQKEKENKLLYVESSIYIDCTNVKETKNNIKCNYTVPIAITSA